MTAEEVRSFNQAISFAQMGWKEEAHIILKQLAQTNPNESNLFLWLAYTAPTLAEAQMLERAARLEPNNPAVARSKNWLSAQEAQQVIGSQTKNSAAMPGWLSASLNSGANYQPGVYLNHQTEQISTIDLKGAHFVAATAPVPTQIKKSGLNLTRVLIIAGIIQLLILGLVGAILLTRSVTHDQIEALGVPVYKNATRLELTKQERDDWLNQVRPTYNNLKNPAFEYYKLKQGDEVNALTFYDRALKSQGWEWASYPPVYIINEALIDRVLNYNRGNQTLYLLVSSQHTSERLPSLKERVASDEVLMQIFVAEKPS